MLNSKTGLKAAVCLTASVLVGTSASAAIIYDNTESYLGQSTGQGNGEIGDVAVFAGTDRILTDFQFEYFLTPTAGGNETARVFLRAMDGPLVDGTALPGTLLYDSGSFTLARTSTGFGTVNVTGIGITLPDSIAWTVSFGGLDAGPQPGEADDERAGLLFYTDSAPIGSNPTFFDPVARSQQHYTIRPGADGGWELLNHPGVTDNLGARFTAVPEPTTWALLLGGLATLGFIRRRK